MSKYWRICAEESGIDPHTGFSRVKDRRDNSNLFHEFPHERYRPRQLFVDLSVNTSDEIFASGTADLYANEQLIVGNEGAEYYSKSTFEKYAAKIHDIIRKQIEACSSLQGFILSHSFSSHTISTSAPILESLRSAYPKATIFTIDIVPQLGLSGSYTNSALNMLAGWEAWCDADLSLPMENSAVANMVRITDPENAKEPERRLYPQMNALSAQLISAMLVTLRAESYINTDLRDFVTNYVTYHTMNTLIAKFSPLIPKTAIAPNIRTLDLALGMADLPATIDFDLSTRSYMAMSMSHIGKITEKHLWCPGYGGLCRDRKYSFVNWVPIGHKYCKVRTPPFYLPESTVYPSPEQCLFLASNLAAGDFLFKCEENMRSEMSSPGAVGRLTDSGVEKASLVEAQEAVRSRVLDYEMCGDFGV